MPSNEEFLEVLERSFGTCLKTSVRSNEKLKILHGKISKDLRELLGPDYVISSLGYGSCKEDEVKGRYMDKRVDISVKKDGKFLGAIAVKFIMSNYSQNSNNYFENMLGETANIRSNKLAYFQIFVIPKHIPYFDKGGKIKKIEEFTSHNIEKYVRLSEDNIDKFMHTPTKTLVFVIDPVVQCSANLEHSKYVERMLVDNERVKLSISDEEIEFGDAVIYNDYPEYLKKVAHYFQFL